MSVYNGERYLREAVDSILAQTYENFEFVIVDDGSTDETAAIIGSYGDQRIRLVQNECNVGLPRSLNRGLAVARGTYIARQDADDVSLPERLATEAAYLDSHPEVGLVGSTTGFMRADGRFAYVFPNPISDLAAKWTMLSHNAFSHTSVMFRSSLLERSGGYPEAPEYTYCEDYDLWSRIAQHARVANLEVPLVRWRMNESSVSHSNADLQLQQVSCVARKNICWVMGWSEMAPRLWAAWRKFWYTPGIEPVAFEHDEVELLTDFLLKLTNHFYSAYNLRGPEVRQHRKHVHYRWGRHALGLSYKPGSGSTAAARLALLNLAVKLLATAAMPHKKVDREPDTCKSADASARCVGGSTSA